MGEKERLSVSTLLIGVALFAPGFLLHVAPRFPGSLAGGLLGIAGALLFVLLLAYSLAKRIPWLKQRTSLRGVLSFHVYAGAVGAVLGILHTGHTYQSPLGIALVVAMLTVVLSGFVGRYYLAQIGTDIRDERQELGTLRTRYDAIASGIAAALQGGTVPAAKPALPGLPIPALVAGIADLEHAVGQREALKRALNRWVVLHIVAALVLYPLLALHIWSGIYYGLRWLP
ncbi:hypothetical protein ACFQY5_38325 [Paeniroseomonas aquatica]|uniref:Iron reductase n=1 Tax=Paeniroseomonas aquatica TaxID=373043 RepID=A0ABT8A2J5_9PROT|nr:hypothetical protein [Paeniroseomonas aquatica]MDN3563876.1 hypothetical protein [Paeniroseomonas aquatica]